MRQARRPSTAGESPLAATAAVGAAAGLPHAALPARSSNANSVANLVADLQQMEAHATHDSERTAHDRQAEPRRHIARAEEAVAKSVDHVEERIEVADLAPDRRQRLDRVEDAGEESHRHDDEVLERG